MSGVAGVLKWAAQRHNAPACPGRVWALSTECVQDGAVAWWSKRRRTSATAASWPRPGYVAIVSAEAQEAAFIDVDLVRRMTEGLPVTQGQELLLDRGGQWWLPEEDVISLRAVLTTLIGRATTKIGALYEQRSS